MKKAIAGLLTLALSMESAGAVRKVSLEELLQSARKNDRELERILHQKTQLEYLKDLSLPTSQILLSLRDEYGLGLYSAGNTNNFTAGVSKDFNSTGTTVSLTYGATDRPDRTERTTQLRLEQSLFRNFFGLQTRRLDRALGLENEVLKLQVAEAYEDYLARTAVAYLDWRLAFSNLEQATALYQDAEKLEANLVRRLRNNIAAPVEVNRAKVQSLSRREALLRAEGEFQALTESIARTYLQPGTPIVPSEDVPFEGRKVDFDAELERLMKEGRSVQLARLQEEASKRRVEISEGELNPDLKFIAGYNVDNSTRFATSVDRSEVVVGVNLQVPLGDSQGVAAVQQSRFQLRQNELQRQILERGIRSSAASLERRIEKQKLTLTTAEQKLAVSRQILAAERRRYEQGKVDLETLISAHNTLAEAEFSVLSQQTELNKLLVEWLRTTDQLLTSL